MTTFKRDFIFDNNYMEKISKNIKKYRLLAGITQEQLAVDVEKSYDFIRRLEYKKGEIGKWYTKRTGVDLRKEKRI